MKTKYLKTILIISALIFNLDIFAQDAAPMVICEVSGFTPDYITCGSAGGQRTVEVETLTGCRTFSVYESLDWLTFTRSGMNVIFTFAQNTGGARNGTVSIGSDFELSVHQDCNPASAAGAISGSSSVCPGQTGVNYYVSPISNATGYVWSLPSGASIVSGSNTNSITVNFSTGAVSGNISVYATGCGNGAPSPNYYVTVNTIGQTGSISGPPFVCAGNTYTYSVSPVTGASGYAWTLPPGASGSSTSNSISITFGTETGYISARAYNNAGCYSSTTSSLLVGVESLVQYNVSGGGTICQGTYSSVSIAGSYSGKTYNLYVNGSYAGSQTGTGGMLTWNNLSIAGTYTVKGETDSHCEVPMNGSAVINVLLRSVAATSISKVSPVCPNGSSTLTATGGSLGHGANWYWYANDLNSPSVYTGNPYSPTLSSTTTYYVKAIGTCNTTSAISTVVNVTTPPSITQQPASITVCPEPLQASVYLQMAPPLISGSRHRVLLG